MTSTNRPIPSMSDDDLLRELGRAAKALPEPPLALQRAALDVFAAAQASSPVLQTTGERVAAAANAAAELAQSAMRHIAAVLSFDSWAAPAVAHGLRSTAQPTRHLLFSAMGRDIDVRITPAAEEFALAGQVLGPDSTGVVELVNDHDGLHQARVTRLDDLGEFRIGGVRRGVHVLTLRLGGDEIVLPPIEVGDRRH